MKLRAFSLLALACATTGAAWSSMILVPTYPDYSVVAFESVSGLSSGYNYGGLGFSGSNPVSNLGPGEYQIVFAIPSDRTGAIVAGALVYGPNGTMFFAAPASTTSSLASVGTISLGALGYLPDGQLVMTATDGSSYPATIVADASGTFQTITLGAAITGPTSPAASFSPVLVGDTSASQMALYMLTGIGSPVAYGNIQQTQQANSSPFSLSNYSLALKASAPEPPEFLLVLGGIVFLGAAQLRRTR